MKNASKAAEDIKNLAVKFKGFLEAAECLEEIGSLEQAKRDAETAKEKAYKDTEYANACLLDAKKDLEKAERSIDDADDKAQAIIDSAQSKCEQLFADAKKKADAIIAEAEQKKKLIEKEEADLKFKNQLIKNDLIDAELELNSIKDEYESIKQKLSQFIK